MKRFLRLAAAPVVLLVAVAGLLMAPTAQAQSTEQRLPFPALGTRDNDPSSVTLGVKFVPQVAGTVVGVEFYRVDTQNKATTVQLWGSGATPLATASGVPMSTGWVRANFATPVPVAAGQTFIASYYAPSGRYTTRSQGWSAARSAGDLSAPVGAGLYGYGSKAAKPGSLYQNEDYDVTPVFVANPVAPTTTTPPPTSTTTPPPTTTTTTPPTTTTTTPPPGGEPPTLPGRLPRANAENTGPTVSTFTPASGDITGNGTVVDGKVYTNYVTIRGNDVQVRNSRFLGGVLIANSQRVVFELNEVQQGLSISSSQDVTVKQVEQSLGGDALHVTSDGGSLNRNIVFDTVWTHSPTAGDPEHVDGLQIRGVDGLTIKGSDIDLGPFQASHNAAFFTQYATSNAPYGSNDNIRVIDCWMNGGGLTFRYEDSYNGVFEVTGLRIGNSYNWGPQYDPRAGEGPTLEADNWYQLKSGTWTQLDLLN